MTRHGYRMVALVSEEDLEFLRHHRPIGMAFAPPNETARSSPAPASTGPATAKEDLVLQARRHPDTMETAEIERLYIAMKDATEIDAVFWWRLKAYTALTLRGCCPDDPPTFDVAGAGGAAPNEGE